MTVNSDVCKCKRCHVEIQGHSDLCVNCYRHLHHACPNCMIRNNFGSWKVRRKGKGGDVIDCAVCDNARFVLYEYKPLPLPKDPPAPGPSE